MGSQFRGFMNSQVSQILIEDRAMAGPSYQAHVEHSHDTTNDLIEIPETIYDSKYKKTYTRERYLGKGGYARCFEVTDQQTRQVFACKVLSKSLLTKQRQRVKMARGISIHRELQHEFVFRVFSFFEDDLYVYVIFEFCNRKLRILELVPTACEIRIPMLEMQKRRHTLRELEVRYFIKQIMTSLFYLHGRKIIHRDLNNLGNIFINQHMNVKLGDFGLAAQCNTFAFGSKRYKLCGTPNYIAPEVLNKKGNTFEADIWSTGCIMYTLLFGAPPFQARRLKEIYVKIKKGEYIIPAGKVSANARALLTQMLNIDPALRPSASQVLESDFLTKSTIPKSLPQSCLTMPPRITSNRSGTDRLTANANGPTRIRAENVPAAPVGANPKPPTELPVAHDKMKQESAGHMRDLLTQLKAVMAAFGKQCKQSKFNADSEDPNSAPIVWIGKWVDYSDKYGFGYQLSDDSIGVSFNDTSKMLLVPDNNHIQYIDRANQEHFYTKDRMPTDLMKKLKLLNYFQQYMTENLIKAGAESVKPDYSMARLPSMWTWFRTSRAVVMVLTNGTLQINNFRDHTKTILCPLLSAISTLEGNKLMKTYKFSYLETQGCTPDLADKISYAIEKLEVVLASKLNKNTPRPSDGNPTQDLLSGRPNRVFGASIQADRDANANKENTHRKRNIKD